MQVNRITLSRGPSIDNQKCVENIGNKFDLVLVAAARAREIKRQHRENPHATFDQIHTNVTALLEVQEGKVGREYLMKVR